MTETSPSVAVIDYGIGNMHSIHKALCRVGARAYLATDSDALEGCDAVVLPGVGAFGACMRALREGGFEEATVRAAASGRPFLGVCVGMQMLFEASDEAPDSIGLGILAGRVRWLPEGVKRPQMQWNRLDHRPDPMFDGLGERPWMYFVHSLAAVPTDPGIVAATCSYGGSVNVAFRSDNIFATQFHPEKSADAGLRLLGNFTVAAQRHAASSRAAR